MGFLDRIRESATQAADLAREGIEEVQARRELSQAYGELGRTAFDLAERGDLAHDELGPALERARTAKAELERLRAERAAEQEPGQPDRPEQPQQPS